MPQIDTTQTVSGEDGVIRITGSRVTLDTVVHPFKQGATAEQIQEDFPSLALRDIYGVIAYYLQRTPAVDDYLRAAEQAAALTKGEIEAHQDSSDLLARLRQRRTAAE